MPEGGSRTTLTRPLRLLPSLLLAGCYQPYHPVQTELVVPDGYRGSLTIFEDPSAPVVAVKNNRAQLVFGSDGTLRVRDLKFLNRGLDFVGVTTSGKRLPYLPEMEESDKLGIRGGSSFVASGGTKEVRGMKLAVGTTADYLASQDSIPGMDAGEPDGEEATSLSWSPNGSTIAVGTSKSLHLLDLKTGGWRRTLDSPMGVSKAQFLTDGTVLAKTVDDLRQIDLSTLKSQRVLQARDFYDRPGENWLAIDGAIVDLSPGDGSYRVWAKGASTYREAKINMEVVGGYAALPNGKILVGDGDLEGGSPNQGRGGLTVFDVRTGKIDRQRRAFGTVRAVSAAPSAGLAAVADEANGIYIVDLKTLAPLRKVSDERAANTSLALSPDGKTLAVWEGRVALYDTATGNRSEIPSKDFDQVNSLAWSPDGKTIAVLNPDQVRLHARDGQKKNVFKLRNLE